MKYQQAPRQMMYMLVFTFLALLLNGCNAMQNSVTTPTSTATLTPVPLAAWKQIEVPGHIEKFLGVAIEEDVGCYDPGDIHFFVILKDKTVYQCSVEGNCIESVTPESLNAEEKGGLGTFCFFSPGDDAPKPWPEGHGAIQDSLYLSGGEWYFVEIFYFIFDDGTLWYVGFGL